MAVLPTDLDFQADPSASPARMNRAMAALHARLNALEIPAKTADAVITQLQVIGLQRLDEALSPVYAALVNIAQLGAIFTTSSETDDTISLGSKTFVIAEGDRDRFAAAAYVTASAGANGVSGPLQSYDRKTGTLSMLAVNTFGTAGAAVSSWLISAGADFVAAKQYTDNGIAALLAQITGGATDAMNTLGEVEARFATLIGTATAAADTLGELQATDTANRQRAADDAVAMSIALG